jgi:hypothetical protein
LTASEAAGNQDYVREMNKDNALLSGVDSLQQIKYLFNKESPFYSFVKQFPYL